MIEHNAGNDIDGTPGASLYQHTDGTRRIGLCPREARDRRESGSTGRQMQKSTACKSHELSNGPRPPDEGILLALCVEGPLRLERRTGGAGARKPTEAKPYAEVDECVAATV